MYCFSNMLQLGGPQLYHITHNNLGDKMSRQTPKTQNNPSIYKYRLKT